MVNKCHTWWVEVLRMWNMPTFGTKKQAESGNPPIRGMMERATQESQQNAAALQASLDRYSASINEQIGTLCDRVESAASSMESAGVAGSRDLAESIQRATARLEQSTLSSPHEFTILSDLIVSTYNVYCALAVICDDVSLMRLVLPEGEG